MSEMLSIFVTWQFILLCIGISTATFFFRKLIDFFILENPKVPANKHSRMWRELILPFTPIIIGIAFGASSLGDEYPYPEALSTWSGKFLFAASAGMLSPIVYRVITSLLRNTIQLPDVGGFSPSVPPINIAPPQNLNIIGGTIQEAPIVIPNMVEQPEPAPEPRDGLSGGTTIVAPSPSIITVEPSASGHDEIKTK